MFNMKKPPGRIKTSAGRGIKAVSVSSLKSWTRHLLVHVDPEYRYPEVDSCKSKCNLYVAFYQFIVILYRKSIVLFWGKLDASINLKDYYYW